jgi:hypothetical protein
MNTRTRMGIAILVVLLATAIGFGIAGAMRYNLLYTSATASPELARARWLGQYVHRVYEPAAQALDLGKYNSIAFNPQDSFPYISYYDATKGDLMLASPVPKGGSNCGVDGNWWCRAVDEEGDVGQHNSIAFWSDGSLEWKLGISYHDQSLGALKFAEYRCIGAVCAWDLQIIKLGDTAFPFLSRG